MKVSAKITVIFGAFLLLAVWSSCDWLFSEVLDETLQDLNTIDNESFYVQNTTNRKFYKVKADILAEGTKCIVYAERGSRVTNKTAQEMASRYDTVIRPRVLAASKTDEDILDYANRRTGGTDGRLTILLVDIKDGYKNKNDSYVAGYFYSGNFLARGPIKDSDNRILGYSNGADMIYIDTYPTLSDMTMIDKAYVTFAHELQHLINFATYLKTNRSLPLDTWIDEGLASQAEYLYLMDNPKDKCEWFVNERIDTIPTGNNFFVWDNYKNKPLAILADYSTVYLFFRWLYLQADAELQQSIYYDIASSLFSDYRAVTITARQINSAWNSWEILLRTWLAANYDAKNSVYGYKNDPFLQNLIKIQPISGKNISLYPGEGVYSTINNSFSFSTTQPNIRYAGITLNSGTVNTASPVTGNMLLTFNANSNNKTSAETGSLTGYTAISNTEITATRTALPSTHGEFGPYILDARDMLGRDQERALVDNLLQLFHAEKAQLKRHVQNEEPQ